MRAKQATIVGIENDTRAKRAPFEELKEFRIFMRAKQGMIVEIRFLRERSEPHLLKLEFFGALKLGFLRAKRATFVEIRIFWRPIIRIFVSEVSYPCRN